MVFSSLPHVYNLDPPNSWPQQQQNTQQAAVTADHGENPQFPPPLLPPPPPQSGSAAGVATAIRPGSMAERARQAKIPQPEAALKCPRCESINTKFCYFNNYSLTQPRHFCKTCRRYWTRGGALRNVPVGGGCRRNNKRSKGGSSRSKSPMTTSADNQSSNNSTNSSTSCTGADVIVPPPPALPFFPSIYNLAEFANLDIGMTTTFAGIHNPITVGNNSSFLGTGGPFNNLSARFGDQWRSSMQPVQQHQFPFLTGLETSEAGGGGGMCLRLEGEVINHHDQAAALGYGTAGVETTEDQLITSKTLDLVKLEENNQQAAGGLNYFSKNFLSINPESTTNDQYWSSSISTTANNAWAADLAAAASASNSASHLM